MSSSPEYGDLNADTTAKKFSFYEILDVSPQATQSEIRDAYRRKSKEYHPDTTSFEEEEASARFQSLKTAYETLRFPEKRQNYDNFLRAKSVTSKLHLRSQSTTSPQRTSAILDAEDRTLSPGEIFALFILGLTFLFCLLIALFLGISRGEMVFHSMPPDSSLLHQLDSVKPKISLTPNVQVDKTSTHFNSDSNESKPSKQKPYAQGRSSSPDHPVTQNKQIPLFPTINSQ